MARQCVRVGTLEPRHFGEHVVAQDGPVELLRRYVPAEHGRIVQVLGEVRAIDEQLLRNAAADHACAADLIFLGDCDPRAISRRHARGAHAAGTGANHEEIEISHYAPALSISARVDESRLSSSASSASCRAICLPSSTPNWSKGLMPISTALAKVRCS